MIYFKILILAVLLFLLYLLIFRYKAPWVPMYKRDLARLDQLLKLKPGNNFYDLGCGNGRVIFYLAKKYPQVNFTGVEISLTLFLICCLRKFAGNYKNVKLKLFDYMLLDLNQADYIYAFANKLTIEDLARKIEKEADKDLVVLSYCFPISSWKKFLVAEENKPGEKKNLFHIYQYKKRDV